MISLKLPAFCMAILILTSSSVSRAQEPADRGPNLPDRVARQKVLTPAERGRAFEAPVDQAQPNARPEHPPVQIVTPNGLLRSRSLQSDRPPFLVYRNRYWSLDERRNCSNWMRRSLHSSGNLYPNNDHHETALCEAPWSFGSRDGAEVDAHDRSGDNHG